MNVENKIKDIIEMLEEAQSSEDWGMVDDARKELTFVFEEMESTFNSDAWDDDTEDCQMSSDITGILDSWDADLWPNH